jgi:hypothetical protein
MELDAPMAHIIRGILMVAATGVVQVVAQLALSLVLLVGAGLLGRSFAELLRQDAGFRREGLLTITLSKAGTKEDNLRGEIRWAKPMVKPSAGATPTGDFIAIPAAPL